VSLDETASICGALLRKHTPCQGGWWPAELRDWRGSLQIQANLQIQAFGWNTFQPEGPVRIVGRLLQATDVLLEDNSLWISFRRKRQLPGSERLGCGAFGFSRRT
jgi:hypothetical protein